MPESNDQAQAELRRLEADIARLNAERAKLDSERDEIISRRRRWLPVLSETLRLVIGGLIGGALAYYFLVQNFSAYSSLNERARTLLETRVAQMDLDNKKLDSENRELADNKKALDVANAELRDTQRQLQAEKAELQEQKNKIAAAAEAANARINSVQADFADYRKELDTRSDVSTAVKRKVIGWLLTASAQLEGKTVPQVLEGSAPTGPAHQNKQGWVYLGEFAGKRWQTSYFSVQPLQDPTTITSGATLTVTADAINVRSEMFTGQSVDVLNKGTRVTVREVKKYPLTQYQWALVAY